MPRRPFAGDLSDQPWLTTIKDLIQRLGSKRLLLRHVDGRILIDVPLPPALAVIAVLFLFTPRLTAFAALTILFLRFDLTIEPD
ncbi:DUF4342 domain-containing protein [Caldichromatium japonicum]|uniref:DUF4342 domain-containing protein n=1 Tax=Caldichromatium japonicum TaxID=2699430 RepID=A0A6G7VA54_9GAMM|nr:DUF4342 domain-containing protein [Caldichromatium japonicum]QIK36738.1 DUF4342 domain-containing protein [Caldichromatium japonicum]